MARLKLEFSNRPVGEQLAQCEQHLANLNRLSPEQLAQVRLAETTEAIRLARASHDEVEHLRMQLKAAVTRRNQHIRAARAHTTAACGMVAVNVGLTEANMIAAGLPVQSRKTPTGVPGQPTDFHAEPGGNEGEVELWWKRPLRRCAFTIAMHAEGETEWKAIATSAATSYLIERLKPGVKYWFRVNASNAHGPGPWSNPVAARAK
jgi:hypothetical protein